MPRIGENLSLEPSLDEEDYINDLDEERDLESDYEDYQEDRDQEFDFKFAEKF